MTHSSLHRLARLIGVSLLVAFAAWCAFSLRADLARTSFMSMWRSWDILLITIGLSLFSYFLRALRWRWYLKQLGHSITIGFSVLTYVAGFAFTLSPGRLGEVIRARYYKGTDISLQNVAATIFVERLMDLLAMLVLATLTVTAFPRHQDVIWVIAITIVTVLVLLTALPWERITRAIRSSPTLPVMVVQAGVAAVGTVVNARSLLRPQAVIIGFLIGLTAWGLEGLSLGLLGQMVPPAHLDVSLAIGIYAIAALIGALSFVPGGLGGTEAVLTVLLATQGYSMSNALLIALASRIVTLWLGISLGWLAVIALRRSSA